MTEACDWTIRTMHPARILNFAAFCVVVVAMLAVEVMWTRDGMTAGRRNELQMAGFVALAACAVGEAALKRFCGPVVRREARGFSVRTKDHR